MQNMEGNLTRARSSLHITPSGLMTSIHSSSPLSRPTPSPQNDPRILPQLGVLPAKHRQLDAAVELSNTSPGHARAYSENSIPAGLRNQSASTGVQYVDRKKADGNGNRTSPPTNKSRRTSLEEARLPSISSPLGSPAHGVLLEPLNENEALPEFEVDHASIRSSFEDEYLDSSGERVLSRSASSMQMRDLRDQMHDLKGRLSVLRDRARDDTMKRRSLQSLRTPSPFTAAEHWYTTDKGYVAPGLSTDAGVGQPAAENVELVGQVVDENNPQEAGEDAVTNPPDYADSETASVYEEASENRHDADILVDSRKRESLQGVEDEGYERSVEDREDREGEEPGDEIDDDDDDIANRGEQDVYESDSSIYHDATSISHEDREDAFDYEHFFLHSAMGTINQQRLERRGSFSSEDSADTARGPQANPTRFLGYLRAESSASVSTMASFATATEGLESEIDDQESQFDYSVQEAVAVPVSPVTAEAMKRSTVISIGPRSPTSGGDTSTKETARPTSVIYNPEERDGKNIHRPSIASFDSFKSTGTTRSFPLVNKSKSHKSMDSNGVLEYRPGHLSGSSMNSSSISGGRSQASPVQPLAKEDQALVEKLVATLGKCVSGLQEAHAESPDASLWRRRIEAARKILEGEE